MMISGITQSLNSGFSQNISTSLTPDLTPTLTPGALSTPGSTFTSSLTPCLTPSLNPTLNPGLQPVSVQSYMGSGGMDPSSLRHLKHLQLRKPPTKSSLAEPNMSEEEVNMRFVQELLSWVEEMQVRPCRCSTEFQKELSYDSHVVMSLMAVAAGSLRVGLGFANCGDAFGEPQGCSQSHRRVSDES